MLAYHCKNHALDFNVLSVCIFYIFYPNSNNDNNNNNEITFPYLQQVKEEKGLPQEQHSLVIMDTLKGQDNGILKEFRSKNRCEIVIVPYNLTHKFQVLGIRFDC